MHIHPGGFVTGPWFQQKIAFHHNGNAILMFQTVSKKMIVCFLSNNPSSVLGSKRSHVRGLRFSHSVRRVFDVCLHISFPVCSHRHWKRRRHFHSCTFRRPLTLEDKLPGMDFLAPFQKQSMLPVWTLTHPRCFNFFLMQKIPLLWLHCCNRRVFFLARPG